jgi:prepilin-type N-terminal cleavage/methylation domain-containing protein
MYRNAQKRSAGFTLLEVMITVGILVLIIGIALPALLKAKKYAFYSRQQSDLHTIGLALEAYKHDFGDYPRFPDPASLANETTANQQWLDYQTDRGARLLCFALLSPGPAGTGAIANPGEDGADGPGFRGRRNIMTVNGVNTMNGKVSGPYLDSAKFKLEFTSGATYPYSDAKLLDGNGNPILYFPAQPGTANIATGMSYVASSAPPGTATTNPPYYNAFDNTTDTTTGNALLSVSDMQTILGADPSSANPAGQVATGKSATTTIPYLLWTAGADGKFGLDTTGKTDDVCNFDIPPNLRK